jgi:hypothetical protein
MNNKQILFFTQIFLVSLLGALQFVDKDRVEASSGVTLTIYSGLYAYRLAIALGLGSVVAAMTGWENLYQPRKLARQMRQHIMQTMVGELFGGDRNKIRVTVFEDASWKRVCYIFMRASLRHPMRWFRSTRWLPPRYGRYVLASQRVGSENPNPNTYFYYSMMTAKDCQGVAGYVRHQEAEIVIHDLPSINELNLHSITLSDTRSPIARKVKKYMEQGFVSDFETLKRLHIKARHFYGNVLYNNKSEPVGVLVIDSIQDMSPFDDSAVTKLAHYTKLFSPTL